MNIFKTITFLVFYGFLSNSAIAEIIINDDRNFTVNEATLVRVDGNLIKSEDFDNIAEGYNAIVLVGDDANQTVTAGTANEILAINQIKGPVTNISPLTVLGQQVISTSGTVFANTSGIFSEGNLLEVSGSFDDQSNLLATRIELKENLDEWKLIAHVTSINGEVIGFGELNVSISGVTVSDCDSGIVIGQLVELKALPIEAFTTNTPLNTVTKFECKAGLVDIPDDTEGTIIGLEIEGFITRIIDDLNIEVNSQAIVISPNVEYSNGTQEDLVVGVKVEVEGMLDTESQIFTALKIDFRETRVRIEAPVLVEDFTPLEIEAMGIIGKITALSEDKDGLLLSGLSETTQLELRGFVDSAGVFFIEEFRSRGNPDNSDTRLRGPVSNIQTNSFEILGVNVNIAGASFFNNQQSPISQTAFFAALFEGALVDINHGSYDDISETISGGEISLEYNVTSSKSLNQKFNKAGGIGGIGLGQISFYKSASVIAPPQPDPDDDVVSSSGGGSLFYLLLVVGLALRVRR